MKKLISFVCLLALACTSVSAAVPVGMHSVPTDIRVMLHGSEISACCVNNSMYIAAEDFTAYGYSAFYDDSVRALFISKISEEFPEPPAAQKLAVTNTLDTDIAVYLNGAKVDSNSVFAYNGKMYLNVSTISRYRDGHNASDPGRAGYPHLLTGNWDGENRIYYIEDSPLLPKDEQRAILVSYNGKREEYSSFLGFTETSYPGEDFEVVSLSVSGLPHGTFTDWYYINNNGRFYYINAVVEPYAFRNYWGNCQIRNARVEGNCLYFESLRLITREPVIKSLSGEYKLNLDTTELTVLNETED